MATTYNNFGGTEFICSFARDITDLRLAQENLKKQIAFERLVADIASNLTQASVDQLDETIRIDPIFSGLAQLISVLKTIDTQLHDEQD